jgi:hypothetical protein
MRRLIRRAPVLSQPCAAPATSRRMGAAHAKWAFVNSLKISDRSLGIRQYWTGLCAHRHEDIARDGSDRSSGDRAGKAKAAAGASIVPMID